MASVDESRLLSADASLRALLKSWRSRYCHIVLLQSQTPRVVCFRTEWARKPTPHAPLPDCRVTVAFSFLYDTQWNDAGEKVSLPASLSYRIEHESLVHSLGAVAALEGSPRASREGNIDHHILRQLKFKSQFALATPLPFTPDQSLFFRTREEYEPLDAPVLAASQIDEVTADSHGAAREVEKSLIDMFQRADEDSNGSLDPAEFRLLLLGSKWGFTEEDVSVVMTQHDANDDGKINYSEFIPIAIDLVQAQRASSYAATVSTRIGEQAYKAALSRVQGSKHLHAAMDAGLGGLDPADTGFVTTSQLVSLLRGMDIDLTDGEIAAVLAKLKALNAKAAAEEDGESPARASTAPSASPSGSSTPSERGRQPIAYKVLQNSYEDLLVDALMAHALDSGASEVELFLLDLFRARDKENSGVLDEATINDVLRSATDKLSLSTTQIYAIIGDHKPLDGNFKYRVFARKAAHMIYQLFDSTSVSERSAMIKRSAITPVQLLSTDARARIERQMKAKFIEFDTNNDGLLSPLEFSKCMSDTGLCLSNAEIAQLRDRADTRQAGQISLSEFIAFSYGTLLHLQRDAALKTQMSAVKHSAAEASEAL